MSKTHKIKETRLWTCEYEIEIDGFLSDEDINEAIMMAWQTTEVKRWFVFKTDDGRKGKIRKMSREVYDKDNRIERLNETEKEFDERINRLKVALEEEWSDEYSEEEWSDEETGIVLVDLEENA